MHILFLTDNFPPEVNAPASRTYEHCREWVKSGTEVTVVTCVPNFPKGKVYDGYKNRLWQSEYVKDIRVIRVWSYMTANEGFLKRTLDYMSFMVFAIFASLFVRKVDVVIGTSPQFFTVCAAYCVALLKRIPWVFELRDIWPETIKTVGALRGSFLIDVLEKIEIFLYKKATAIISVTQSFRVNLMQRGICGGKIHVVTNGVDSLRFSPMSKDAELLDSYRLHNKFVIGYIGTHGLCHALDTILNGAKKLNKDVKTTDFHFLLLGDGANKENLVKKAEREDIRNFIFIDSVSKDEVARYWSLLDVSIIHLKKARLFKSVIPSKLFECMGMSIPVAHGVEGESAEIVNKEGVGLCFEPENVDSLCSVVKRLYNDRELYTCLKSNGPKAAQNYDRSMLAKRMLNIVKSVV